MCVFYVLTCLHVGNALAQEHLHINAGAISAGISGQLYFENGANYVAGSGYVFEPDYRPIGQTYGGYYVTDNVTFSALAATADFGGPEPHHAELGAFIRFVVEIVTGPENGRLGFWESDWGLINPTPTFSIETGTANANQRFDITENIFPLHGPNEDPWGHIHERAFSFTLPGVYDVTGYLADDSNHGGNGPRHLDSVLYTFRFEVVPEPVSSVLLLIGAVMLLRRQERRRV